MRITLINGHTKVKDFFDFTAPKRAFNLFLNEDLVKQTRTRTAAKLSVKVEALLAADLAAYEENALAEAESLRRAAVGWNTFVQKHGSFADEFSTL